MIALDTNLLVRYITQDDDAQSAVATGVIENRCTPEAPGWISLVVLCELVWVLTRAYRYEKALIADVLDRLVATSDLRVEQEDLARAALAAWRNSGADFADHVILESARAAGALPLVTLDRRLAGQPETLLATDIEPG